jgi:hypothetical protein
MGLCSAASGLWEEAMRSLMRRRTLAALCFVSWLGFGAIGFTPMDHVPQYTKESLAARVLFWLPTLIMSAVGLRRRFWEEPACGANQAEILGWRAALMGSVLVVCLDIVLNTLVLAVMLGDESLRLGGPLAIAAAIVASWSTRRLSALLRPSGPSVSALTS